jgi:multidrug efflux system membrane fusion protein
MRTPQKDHTMPDAPQERTPDRILFESDPGSSKSKWAAVISFCIVLGWMGSGYILPSSPPAPKVIPTAVQPRAVEITSSVAEDIVISISTQGETTPARRAEITSIASGEILSITARPGEILKKGDIILRLEDAQVSARLEQARQEMTRAERELDNARRLLERGVGTTDRVTEATVDQAAAQANFEQARRDLENTIVRSPFDGVLDALDVEEGETLQTSTRIGVIIDASTLDVRLNIPQQNRTLITSGLSVEVLLITGQKTQGEIMHVSLEADASTRTFRVEVKIDNPDQVIASGISATVIIPLETKLAHRVTPAALTLAADGRLGLKAVSSSNHVLFHPAEIARSDTLGTWVTGLPENLDIITLGAGYVEEGDIVDARPAKHKNREVAG